MTVLRKLCEALRDARAAWIDAAEAPRHRGCAVEDALWRSLTEAEGDLRGAIHDQTTSKVADDILEALDSESWMCAAHEWKPVKTAPEDTWILMWSTHEDAGGVACCLDGVWWSRAGRLVHTPSHWLPLPVPPT